MSDQAIQFFLLGTAFGALLLHGYTCFMFWWQQYQIRQAMKKNIEEAFATAFRQAMEDAFMNGDDSEGSPTGIWTWDAESDAFYYSSITGELSNDFEGAEVQWNYGPDLEWREIKDVQIHLDNLYPQEEKK